MNSEILTIHPQCHLTKMNAPHKGSMRSAPLLSFILAIGEFLDREVMPSCQLDVF